MSRAMSLLLFIFLTSSIEGKSYTHVHMVSHSYSYMVYGPTEGISGQDLIKPDDVAQCR